MRALEDAQAIRNLKASYAEDCDAGYDAGYDADKDRGDVHKGCRVGERGPRKMPNSPSVRCPRQVHSLSGAKDGGLR